MKKKKEETSQRGDCYYASLRRAFLKVCSLFVHTRIRARAHTYSHGRWSRSVDTRIARRPRRRTGLACWTRILPGFIHVRLVKGVQTRTSATFIKITDTWCAVRINVGNRSLRAARPTGCPAIHFKRARDDDSRRGGRRSRDGDFNELLSRRHVGTISEGG